MSLDKIYNNFFYYYLTNLSSVHFVFVYLCVSVHNFACIILLIFVYFVKNKLKDQQLTLQFALCYNKSKRKKGRQLNL